MIETIEENSDALVYINDEKKLICLYGETTKDEITQLKNFKPKYIIAKFHSGSQKFGDSIKNLVLNNI